MKVLCISLVLIGLLELAWTLPAPKIGRKKCQKRNGFFEMPGSFCRKYFKCNNWIPVEKICPPDQHFDPHKQRCDWEELYPCLEKPTRKECPRSNGNFLKPGTHCKIYYSCCDGQPTEKRCPGDTLFHPDKEKCEWPELYTCVESTSPAPTDFVTPSTTLSSPENTPTFDVTDSTSIPTLASSTITDIPEETSTLEETSSSSPLIISTLSTMEETSSLDDLDLTSASTLTSSTIMSTPDETSTIEEISSSTTLISTSLGTVENTATFDDTQTSTSTEETLLITSSTVSPISTETIISSSTDEVFTETEPNVDSSSPETSIYDFSTIDIVEITTETDLLTSTESYTTTDVDIFETTSVTDNEERTLTPTEITKEITSSSFSDSTPGNEGTSTSYTSSPRIEDFVCPERSGYFPHPTDRHKFIGCVNWIPQIMDCPSKLVYNHKARACVYDRKKADHLSKN